MRTPEEVAKELDRDQDGYITTNNEPFTSENLASTPICEGVRVSTGIEVRENWWGKWLYIDTWIFSDKPWIRSTQVFARRPKEGLRQHEILVKWTKRAYSRALKSAQTTTNTVSQS